MEAAEWREWHKTSDGVEICALSISSLSRLSRCFFPCCFDPALSSTLFASTVWTIDFVEITCKRKRDACLFNFQVSKKMSTEEVSFSRWRFAITSGFLLDAFSNWHFRFKCTNMKRWNYLSIKLRNISWLIFALSWFTDHENETNIIIKILK